jgi:thiol-disulfide isomerase/thioredoxin
MNIDIDTIVQVMTYTIEYIGAKWCTSCRTVKPMVIEKAAKYGINLRLYDMDEDVDLFDTSAIQKLPTIRVKKAGTQVQEISTNHVATLEEFLSTHIQLTTSMDIDF